MQQNITKLQIKKIINIIICDFIGCKVSVEEEDRLYGNPPMNGRREIESQCERCGGKLFLRVDTTDEDSYFVYEI
jgi:hypothetical protein